MDIRRWALALTLLLGACATEEPEDSGLTSDTGLPLLASGPDEAELTEDLPRIEPYRLASPGTDSTTLASTSAAATGAGPAASGGSGPGARAAGPGGGPRSRWVRWNSGGALDYDRDGDAYWDEPGHAVEPGSLYLAQLRDRLGQAAVDNVTR